MNSPELTPVLAELGRLLPPGFEICIRFVVPEPGAVAAPAPVPPREQVLPFPGSDPEEPMKLKAAAARYGVSVRSLDLARKENRLHCLVKTNGRDSGAFVVTPEEMKRYIVTQATPEGRRVA